MKNIFAICLLAFGLTLLSGCEEQKWTDIICKDGYAMLVPEDDHDDGYTNRGKYVCGKTLPDDSDKYIQSAVNGVFTIDYFKDISYKWGTSESGHSCGFFNSMDSCNYKNCPDCMVVYCNERNQLTISDVSCYEYYVDKENDNTLFKRKD